MTNTFANYFHSILESKFRKIDESLIPKVKDTVSAYNLLFRKITKTDLKTFTTKVDPTTQWFNYFKDEKVDRIGVIKTFKFRDLETNQIKKVKILIAYGQEESSVAYYDKANNFAVLYQSVVKNFTDSELEAVIVHELTHGAQEYKITSPEYDAEVKKLAKGKPYNRQVYYLEPIEFDAHLTELGYRITEEYNKIKNGIAEAVMQESKKVFERRLARFLLEFSIFIKADISSYLRFKELPLPSFFSTHTEFLETISKNPSSLKKLKQKLSQLYFDLTAEFP